MPLASLIILLQHNLLLSKSQWFPQECKRYDLPLPLLTFVSTSNQPCATNNIIKCCPWVPSVLSKIKLSSPVFSCIASSQAQKLFFMHIHILEYCFPKLLNESPDGQMVLFCQSNYLNSVTSIVDIFSCTNPRLSRHLYQALHILTFCFLCSFPASMLRVCWSQKTWLTRGLFCPTTTWPWIFTWQLSVHPS